MASFEALYKMRRRSPIGWFEVGEARLFGPDLAHQAMNKVKMIREMVQNAQSHQRSYTEVCQGELEF